MARDLSKSNPQPAQMEHGEQIEIQNISISSDKIRFMEIAHIDALNLCPTQKRAHKACCCRPCQDERGKYYSNLGRSTSDGSQALKRQIFMGRR